MKAKRKPGRKSDLERMLIKIAALARKFGEVAEELSATSTLIDHESTLIDRTLLGLEASHDGLVILYEVKHGPKTGLEQLALKMTAFARDLKASQAELNVRQATTRAELAIVEEALTSLKNAHDYFVRRFEAKAGQL